MTKRRIVIAEDEPLARLDLSQMLENLGHEVVGQAGDGQTAVDLARELKPELVIMDIKMPGEIDGLGAATLLAEERVAPVLLLTAYSDQEFIDGARDAGVMGYLVKPYGENQLAPAIEVVLARFGEFWADFEIARDADVSRCAHTMMSILLRCEARGRPCLVATENSSPISVLTPVPCNQSDSRNCNPYVKALQIRLTQKGCRTGADGAAGPSTARAVRCFQRQANLAETGEVDLATVYALNR